MRGDSRQPQTTETQAEIIADAIDACEAAIDNLRAGELSAALNSLVRATGRTEEAERAN